MTAGSRRNSLVRMAGFMAAVIGVLGLAAAVLAQTPPPAAAKPLEIARFSPAGKLLKPADLTSWIFLGTSLGMGYNPGSFNAAHPGQFQVVLMEPTAYRYFLRTRRYAPGSMFLLVLLQHRSAARSINQNGFVQADLTNYEIHLMDPRKGKDGALVLHVRRRTTRKAARCRRATTACAATWITAPSTARSRSSIRRIRPLIPKEALERAMKDHDIR